MEGKKIHRKQLKKNGVQETYMSNGEDYTSMPKKKNEPQIKITGKKQSNRIKRSYEQFRR